MRYSYKDKKLIIFDLDGTLTPSKSQMDKEMSSLLVGLLKIKKVAVMSGGSFEQFQKQFLKSLDCPEYLLKNLFLFPTCATSFFVWKNKWENVYKEVLLLEEKTKIKEAFQVALKQVNHSPSKIHGNLIEDRETQITFSALGQRAPTGEKETWDPESKKRKKIKKILDEILPEFEIRIGGTTSIDVTRKGIDKAYGIAKIEKHLGISKDAMLFMGDALFPGGNDYPVLECGVSCISVNSPEITKKEIQKLFGKCVIR